MQSIVFNIKINDKTNLIYQSAIFKYICLLKFQFNPLRFKIPKILFELKENLKKNLNNLSNTDILNIFIGYQHVLKEISHDLIDEIYNMIISTLEDERIVLKTEFLLELSEKSNFFNRNYSFNVLLFFNSKYPYLFLFIYIHFILSILFYFIFHIYDKKIYYDYQFYLFISRNP